MLCVCLVVVVIQVVEYKVVVHQVVLFSLEVLPVAGFKAVDIQVVLFHKSVCFCR